MKYLFKYLDKLSKTLRDKNTILFLDYDGTLTPIAESPEKAVLSNEIRDLLEGLSKNPRCKISIISGRSLKNIKNLIGLRNIIYSGNHGLELEGPKVLFKNPIPPMYLTMLRKIKNELENKLSPIKGVLIEDKGLSLSVHYRLVNKDEIPSVQAIFYEVIITYLVKGKIKTKSGKMVLEVKPPVEWDKGKVVLWLLASQKFIKKSDKILPVYIGDDLTDEDAFKAIRNIGWTIYVGKPKKSYAEYYVKNTNEVSIFLKELLLLKGDLCQT